MGDANDGCEVAGQVGARLDLVQVAGLNERREHDPILRAGVVTVEEPMYSLQSYRTDGLHGRVALHLDAVRVADTTRAFRNERLVLHSATFVCASSCLTRAR